jgi:UDP-N-acetylglucosamine diphosphorylase/glucosamine-1-phosphate N-acetyltransferase
MHVVLFDHPEIRQNLLPFTFTRPVAGIRIGIHTIAEKWASRGAQVSYLTEPYLSKKFAYFSSDSSFYINGAICPDAPFLEAVRELRMGEVLVKDCFPLAWQGGQFSFECLQNKNYLNDRKIIPYSHELLMVQNPWDIFVHNGEQLRADYRHITSGRSSQPVNDAHTACYGAEHIFVEEGARIKSAVLNAENGPIYIGKNAEIGEGTIIRGPFAIGEHASTNLGARFRGDTTIGPYCKVGGEVSNSVLFGYSSKAHDGFLGNSVIGEWCNLGADTNTSNLKNNYMETKLWNYASRSFKKTGRQFCGLMLGDHSKCGINTMFNTATTVGVGANIFGSGFPRAFIPSFAWGGAQGFSTFRLAKFLEMVPLVLERRGKVLDDTERQILEEVYNRTKEYRVWDKEANAV